MADGIAPLAFQLAQQGSKQAYAKQAQEQTEEAANTRQMAAQNFQMALNQAAFENSQRAAVLQDQRNRENEVFRTNLETQSYAQKLQFQQHLKDQENKDAEALRIHRNVTLAQSLKSMPNASEDMIYFANLVEAGLDPANATHVINNKDKMSAADKAELNARLQFVNTTKQYSADQLKDPLIRKQIADSYTGKNYTYVKNYFDSIAPSELADPWQKPTAAMKEFAATGGQPGQQQQFGEFLKGGKGSPQVSMQLRQQFQKEPVIREYKEVSMKVHLINSAYEESKKTNNHVATDQALITLFNKMTDPNSVVRESEYARTAMDLPTTNRILGKLHKWQEGGPGITEPDRKAIINIANIFFTNYKKEHNDIKDYYSKILAPQFSVSPSIFGYEFSQEAGSKGSSENDPLGLR